VQLVHLLTRSWGIFVLWLLALIFALGSRRGIAYDVFYFLTGIIVLALIWAWLNIRGLGFKRGVRAQRAQMGRYFEESHELLNRSRWPKLWVEVRDFSTLPGHQASRVVTSLGGRSVSRWQTRTLCYQRGCFVLGPAAVTSSDPLGIFRLTRQIPSTGSIIVTPATVPIPQFSPPIGYLPGGETMHRRTPYITTSVSGVREYAPGDSFNRIHWPSSARAGRLISKEFELDPLSDVWIFMDMHDDAQAETAWSVDSADPMPWLQRRPEASLWLPPSTVEYGVTIAASLAQHFLQTDREVGFLSYARTREVIQPDRGERQLSRMLEVLAVIQGNGAIPIAQVLTSEGAHLARHTTLIVITSSTDPRWVAALRGLRARGVNGVAVLLAGRTFGPAPDWQPILADLHASGLATYLVKYGDDLAETLGQAPRERSRAGYGRVAQG
jgi:uncharacterized protein (DUF58 family)